MGTWLQCSDEYFFHRTHIRANKQTKAMSLTVQRLEQSAYVVLQSCSFLHSRSKATVSLFWFLYPEANINISDYR